MLSESDFHFYLEELDHYLQAGYFYKFSRYYNPGFFSSNRETKEETQDSLQKIANIFATQANQKQLSYLLGHLNANFPLRAGFYHRNNSHKKKCCDKLAPFNSLALLSAFLVATGDGFFMGYAQSKKNNAPSLLLAAEFIFLAAILLFVKGMLDFCRNEKSDDAADKEIYLDDLNIFYMQRLNNFLSIPVMRTKIPPNCPRLMKLAHSDSRPSERDFPVIPAQDFELWCKHLEVHFEKNINPTGIMKHLVEILDRKQLYYLVEMLEKKLAQNLSVSEMSGKSVATLISIPLIFIVSCQIVGSYYSRMEIPVPAIIRNAVWGLAATISGSALASTVIICRRDNKYARAHNFVSAILEELTNIMPSLDHTYLHAVLNKFASQNEAKKSNLEIVVEGGEDEQKQPVSAPRIGAFGGPLAPSEPRQVINSSKRDRGGEKTPLLSTAPAHSL